MTVCDVITFNRFAQESSFTLDFPFDFKVDAEFKARSRENESKTNIYFGRRRKKNVEE